MAVKKQKKKDMQLVAPVEVLVVLCEGLVRHTQMNSRKQNRALDNFLALRSRVNTDHAHTHAG